MNDESRPKAAPQTPTTKSTESVPSADDGRRRLWRWRRTVVDDTTVTGWRQETLLVLGALFRGDGTGYASHRQLAEKLGCSARTARRRVTWAVAAGWLERTGRGHRLGNGTVIANEYWVTFPEPEVNGPPECPVEADVKRTPDRPVEPNSVDNSSQEVSTDTSKGQPVHSTGHLSGHPNRNTKRNIQGNVPLRGMNDLGLGKNPDTDGRYDTAKQRCLREPDFGVAAQERAREELGDDASPTDVVIRAALLLHQDITAVTPPTGDTYE